MSAIDKDRKPEPSKPLPKKAPVKKAAAKKAPAKKAPAKKAPTKKTAPATTPASAVVDPAPNPHATAEQVEAAYNDTKLAQVLYHDWEAETYDEKWSISFDQRIVDFAKERFDKIVPDAQLPYERAMELGCGTGFFLLNLMQAGVAKKGSVTDLSPGMVKVALRNAENLGLDVDGRVADAEKIPYDDDTFDLVVGHAVLHHIPDVEKSLREVLRVLKPGGRFVFAGEPSTIGDYYARRVSRATWWATTNLTKFGPLKQWRRPQEELDESSRAAALEAVVDIHTFSPADLEKLATAAGAVDVETASEELAAALLGWPVRTFEAAVPKEKLGWGWAGFAYGGYKRMTWLDENVLKRFVPSQFFYNVLITGTKPEK
ncbi:MAG: methyltransferase domain-containing protein [Gordonia sp. (in: high G+C Gram-positive bacteria)]|uniref:class I SAM-dependent methyltransferase n=1 Tax=Gordonia sp. (in: high G+C Gram-positive bacteria) TaxID=84139 RepID=UPI0039E32CF1